MGRTKKRIKGCSGTVISTHYRKKPTVTKKGNTTTYSYPALVKETFTKCHSKDIKLILKRDQWMRIRAMYDVCVSRASEMLGLGKVKFNKEAKTFTLEEMFIPEQTAGGASCDVTQEAVAKLIMEQKFVNFWVHTHPGMSAFWSGTDDDTARELCSHADRIVSVVIGRNHEMEARVDLQKPADIMISIPIEMKDFTPNPFIAEINKEFETKVAIEHFYTRGFWKGHTTKGKNSRIDVRSAPYDYIDSYLDEDPYLARRRDRSRRIHEEANIDRGPTMEELDDLSSEHRRLIANGLPAAVVAIKKRRKTDEPKKTKRHY